ncbi:MAG: heavy-metal-associated domain-containing protein [Propionibacteriaceae bacterium]
MSVLTYTVAGMTCGHCVQAVTEEVEKLDGVTDVVVDLATGSLTLTSTVIVDADAVAAAVDEAGYELVRG